MANARRPPRALSASVGGGKVRGRGDCATRLGEWAARGRESPARRGGNGIERRGCAARSCLGAAGSRFSGARGRLHATRPRLSRARWRLNAARRRRRVARGDSRVMRGRRRRAHEGVVPCSGDLACCAGRQVFRAIRLPAGAAPHARRSTRQARGAKAQYVSREGVDVCLEPAAVPLEAPVAVCEAPVASRDASTHVARGCCRLARHHVRSCAARTTRRSNRWGGAVWVGCPGEIRKKRRAAKIFSHSDTGCHPPPATIAPELRRRCDRNEPAGPRRTHQNQNTHMKG